MLAVRSPGCVCAHVCKRDRDRDAATKGGLMQLGPGWESEKSWEKGVRAPEPRSSGDSVGWNGVR